MNRRTFAKTAAGAALASLGTGTKGAAPPSIPVIDSHIHLFDPTRPGGVPWPPKDNAVLYKPALPDRYRAIAAPFGVVGAIEVEASPLLEDNQWVLDIAAKNPIIVGMVGNLEPGKPDFPAQLDRFHKNPLFLGIRYGNLWGRDLTKELPNPEFVAGLKALAAAGLELDSANPTPVLLESILRVSDLVPDLRIVIDHLPQLEPPKEAGALKAYQSTLQKLSQHKQVYVKISEVLRRVDGNVPEDLNFYRGRIDELFGLFGEDRVIYGSDWPNSDNWRPYPQVFHVVHEYFMAKGPAIAEKYFWKNSKAAYRWKKRDASQP